MYIYNITISVDNSIHTEWLNWIQTHIPQVLSTGWFTEAKLIKVLAEGDSGVTYSVQYRAKSREDLDNYYKKDAARLQQESIKLFADKVLAFRTELQIIDEYSVNFN